MRKEFGAVSRVTIILAGAAGASLFLSARSAIAQEAAKSSQIDEVVVTANKRKEDASKVPQSISVLDANQLQEAHIANFADIARSLPGVAVTDLGGPGLGSIQMRGISSQAGAATVGTYVDDVPVSTRYLYSQGEAEPKFFDIRDIEVLRGPQGTLYGAGSEGGTLKITTNQPNLDKREGSFYSELSGTRHGGLNYQETGIYNQPIIPGKMALRFGLQLQGDSGWIDRVSPATGRILQNRVNSDTQDVAKFALKIQPNPDLTITPQIFLQRVQTKDISAFYTGAGVAQLQSDSMATPASLGRLQTLATVPQPGKDSLAIPSLTVNYETAAATITSVTSYFLRQFERTQDGSYVNDGFLGGQFGLEGTFGANGNLSNLPSPIYLKNYEHQYSEELRAVSRDYDPQHGLPVTWVGGLFWSDAHTVVSDAEYSPGLTALVNNFCAGQPASTCGGHGIVGLFNNAALTNDMFAVGPNVYPGFPNSFAHDQNYYSFRSYWENQYAVFGEATWYFTPSLRFTVGLRYLIARESLQRDGDFYFNGPNLALTSDRTNSAFVSNNYGFTPKFSLAYDIDADNTAYGTISKGYRLGGPNRPINSNVCHIDLSAIDRNSAPDSYYPDKLWNYETGLHSRLFGRRVAINADVFYINWENIQQDVVLPTCGYDFETNAGDAASYGGELEVKVKLTSDFLLGVNGSITHAALTSAAPNVAVSGQAVEGVPLWNAGLEADYYFDISDALLGSVRLNWSWVGHSHGNFLTASPDYERPAYDTLGLSVGVDYSDWKFSLFAKNLTNDRRIIQQPQVQTVDEGITLAPRTIGVSAAVKF